MKLSAYSPKKYLLALLCLGLIVIPFWVQAEKDSGLDKLETDLNSVQSLVLTSTSLTEAGKKILRKSIRQIRDEITLLRALEVDGVTAEVVVDKANLKSQIDVITSAGVRRLKFSFEPEFASKSQSEFVAATVQRAAQVLSLQEGTLASGVQPVKTFSGLKAPATPTLESAVAPSAEKLYSNGRKNVEQIYITGGVPNFRTSVEVVYGPEEVAGVSFDRATITQRYNFVDKQPDSALSQKLRYLVIETRKNIAKDFGLSYTQTESLETVTLQRYKKASDVPKYSASRGDTDIRNSTANYFGSYSIIEDIAVHTGRNTADIVFWSDQDEVLMLSLRPQYRPCGKGNECPTGKLNHYITYRIHDVLTEAITETGFTFRELSKALEIELKNIGLRFGTKDSIFAAELATFLAANDNHVQTRQAFDVADYRIRPKATGGRAGCVTERDEKIIEEMVDYMLGGMQFSTDIATLVNIYPQQIVVDRESSIYSGYFCSGNRQVFFPSQP